MCPACCTPDGKIIGAGINFEYIGNHRETAELLTKCLKCGDYYLSDAFSPSSRAVSKEWVRAHYNAFLLDKKEK